MKTINTDTASPFAEILIGNSEIIAIADFETLSVSYFNKNFLTYFNLQEEQVRDVFFYDLIKKKVSREKLEILKKELEESSYYSDDLTHQGNKIVHFLIKHDNRKYCLIRINRQSQESTIEQYRLLFERNLAGVYKSKLSGELVSCNIAFAEILGYKEPSELIGRNVSDFYFKSSERKKFLQQLEKQPVLINFEVEVLRKDGTTACCLENSYLEKSNEGIGYVSGTLIDISEKQRIEKVLQESEQRFKILSSVSNDSVVFCQDEIVTDSNDQFAKLFGYQNRNDVLSRKLTEFFTPQDIKRVKSGIEISPANRNEIRTFDKNGKTIFVEISGSVVKYRSQQVLALVVNDITSRKKAEFALEQSVFRFKNLLENSPNGVIILTEGKIKYINHAGCVLFAVEEEDDLYDKSFIEFLSAEFKREINDDLDNIREGKEIDYKEIKIIDSNDVEVDVGIKSILTVYENKPSIQITLNNVTVRKQLVQEQIRLRLIEEINTVLKKEIEEHKKTQGKLKAQQRETTTEKAKLESILNSTENLMIFTVDSEYRLTSLNKNFVTWMDVNHGVHVVLGDHIIDLLNKYVDPDFYQGQLQAFSSTFKGRHQQFELPLCNAEGKTIWVQVFLNPIYMDGQLNEISCLAYDTTERKDIDRKVRDSLKEKEVLLQEVHHRVKNNLQVISSILNLQSSYVDDEKTKQILEESQQRIKSMSYIHETLYRTADFSKLEFTDYLTTITSNLIQSYRLQNTRVDFEPEMDQIFMSLDQSIPCGLIVNELVSNALKYAFKGKKIGKLRLVLKEINNEVYLLVADNGVGLHKEFKYEKTDSLGIQLVYSLVEQLDATMDIKTEQGKGTSFEIRFNKK